jgi:hypothetical protein
MSSGVSSRASLFCHIYAAQVDRTMQIREFLHRHSAFTTISAVVMLAATGVYAAWWLWPRTERVPQAMAYFYDLNTGELLELPVDTEVPFETESGPYDGVMPAGVWAHVYCCGPYLEGTEKFVGYVEVPFDRLPEELRPPGMEPDPELELGAHVIRRPDEKVWHDPAGPVGTQIIDELHAKCPEGKRLTYITPVPK